MHVSHKFDSFEICRDWEFSDRDFQIFAWAFQLKFKNVNLNEFEIKFPIE